MQESERIFIAENATLLRGSERELNRQLFTILNSIYDGLYITDGQANTILINRAYEEVSGLRREDVLGKSMQEIVATGMIDRSGSLGVLKTRKPVTLEQTFRTGKRALITSTPHFDSSGEITMIITVVRDMTEIYGLQRKYQESEERRRSEMEFLQRNQRFVSRMVAADPRTLEVLARARRWPPWTRRSCCWGRPAWARSSSRGTYTKTPPAPGRASSASTAAPSRPA